MESIGTEQIIEYLRDEVVYRIGQENYNNGLIQLEFVGKYLVKSKVNENSKHRVMVEFKRDGLIKKSLCTCMEFEFTSPCRHVVATCFELIDFMRNHPNRFISNNTLIQEYSLTKSTELADLVKEIYIDNPTLLFSPKNYFNINFNNFNGIDESNNKVSTAPKNL
ncbi:hypothetical protein ACTFIV_004643 [Dictyostelium citrinum]